MIFRFKNFPVYQDSLNFRQELKELIKNKFPSEEKFCLSNQIIRALDSIILNIAEGADRLSDVDFSRFLNTALGSLNEVVASLDLALGDGYITKKEFDYFNNLAEKIYIQLKAFCAKVRRDNARN